MKKASNEKVNRYSFRKSSYGLVSATIASLFFSLGFFPNSSVAALSVDKPLEYRYVTEYELSKEEQALIVKELPKVAEESDDIYYLVYRPVEKQVEKILPKTGSDGILLQSIATLTGAGLLLVAVKGRKNSKKGFAGIFLLTVSGSMLLAPSAVALTNQTLVQYNQILSTKAGEALPEPLSISGYQYIGYLKTTDTDSGISENVVSEEETVKQVADEGLEKPELSLSYDDSTHIEVIPYSVQEIENSELPVGTRQVVQKGSDGERQTTIRTYMVDGQIIKTEELSNNITVEPTTEIVHIGTKVAEVPTEVAVTETDSTEYQTIEYTTVEVENSELLLGTRQVSQVGVNGERQITTRTYSAQGEIINTIELSNVITKESVPEIIQVGTKVVEEVPTEAPSHEVPTLEVVTSDTVETEDVLFETIEVENSELLAGERQISQSGKNGQREIVTRNYVIDNQLLKTEEISNQVIVEPIPEIIQVGTKIVEKNSDEAPTHSLPSLEITTEDTSTTEKIPYEIQEVENAELLKGVRKTIQNGVEGERQITTRLYSVEGQVVKVEELSNKVVQEPLPEIVQIGTKELKDPPTLVISEVIKDEARKAIQARLSLNNPGNSYIAAVAQIYQGTTLVSEVSIEDVNQYLDITGLEYYTDYTLKTVVTYDLGGGPQSELQASTQDFRLEYKKIEIKDIDEVELFGLENGQYRRYLSLEASPVNLDDYFVKIQSDRFKEMLLPISKIEEVEINGEAKYKLTVSFDELVQDKGTVYDDNYSFYVAKQTPTQNGVYTSFKALVEAMEADPSGQFIIGADMTADEIQLPEGSQSYVTAAFSGNLTATHNGVSYTIYHLANPLFDTINKASISNIDLVDVKISSNTDKVGALAKTAIGSQIRDVSIEGSIVAPANIGGIVYLANGGTEIQNSSFTGQLVGTSTTLAASNIGGIAGVATGNKTLVSGVKADVDMTVSALNGNHRVGALVGHLNTNARLENAYATGDITNLRTTGQVGGAVGSTYWYGIVNNVISSVDVTNGRTFHGDTGYKGAPITNAFVTDAVSGTRDQWSTEITETEAAEKSKALPITTTIADSQTSRMANLYSVDYSNVDAASADRITVYKNMEKLLPFYNKEYLVTVGNKVALTDKLAQTLLVDVVPMVGNQIVTDPHSQKLLINRIMLHYADGTVSYLDVTFKEDFKNSHVSDYSIAGTDLLYTPESFLSNYDSAVVRLVNEMATVTFDSAEVKSVLGIVEPETTPTAQRLSNWAADLGVKSTTVQKPLWALYLEDSFNDVRNNLAEQLRKVLASDKAINTLGSSVERYLIEKISRNKEALILGLAYLNRWYNIDFGDLNTRDLSVFKQDFFGNQEASTLDTIIALGNSGYDNLRPKNNITTYTNSLKSAKGKDTVFNYLETYRNLFLPGMTNNEWLKKTSKAYIVEAQSTIADVAEKQKSATAESKYTIGVYDRLTQSSWAYQNMLLPLLTLPEENVFIISNMSTLSFGAYDRYLYDRAAEGRDFTEYMHELVDRAAIWQRDHFDFWYKMLPEESREKLFQAFLNYDGFNFRDSSSSATWKTLQNTDRSSIANFFGPVGKWYDANGTGAYANGYVTHFVVDRLLDQYGSSVFTHEMVHNFDGSIYFDGNGRRQGQGPELFALGLLQTPNGNQSRTLGINTMFTGNEDSLIRYHAANPRERYQSVEDLNTYTHNMFDVIYLLDYLEAKSVLKQSTEVKQKWYRVIGNYYIQSDSKDTHAGNTIRHLTTDEAASLLTINDLVDKSIINRREYWDKSEGLVRNGYYTISPFSSIYSALANSNGSPGDVMFRRMAYELMAEKGYVDGFIPYVSNQLGDEAMAAGSVIYDEWFKKNVGLITDDMVFDHIFKDEYTDWADFKKAMYQDRINQVGNLIDFTMTYELDKPNSTNQVAITSFADLETLMDAAVAQDMKSLDTVLANNNSSWVNVLKQRIYNALLRTTNDFTSSIFK